MSCFDEMPNKGLQVWQGCQVCGSAFADLYLTICTNSPHETHEIVGQICSNFDKKFVRSRQYDNKVAGSAWTVSTKDLFTGPIKWSQFTCLTSFLVTLVTRFSLVSLN